MKKLAWIAITALCLAFVAKARGFGPGQADTPPTIGEPAPELTGAGEGGRLADYDGVPLVVYFASSATRDSKIALGALAEDLAKATDLAHAKLLVILPSDEDVVALRDEISALTLEAHTVISSDRDDMLRYGVIAYPTAFVLDAEHKVAAIVRGYGTLSSFRTLTALRFASGLITRDAYLHLTGETSPVEVPKPDRYVRMAEKLIGEERTALAFDALTTHLDAESPLRHVVLTARLAVSLGDEVRTKDSLERLALIPEAAGELVLLEIERDLRRGKLESAEQALDALTATHSARTRYLRGLLAEARGDAATSAEDFREAAETFATLGAMP